MLKTNNVVLLKAIAMGAILANGSIGYDPDDRNGKRFDKPSHHSRSHTPLQSDTTSQWQESHAQYTVDEIMSPIDERARIARDVLSRPRIIDFNTTSIEAALKLLSYAKQYSVKLKLKLLNVTAWNLETILSENDGNIEELEWAYNLTPASLIQTPEEDYDKKYTLDTWYDLDDEEGTKDRPLKYLKTNKKVSDTKFIEDDKDDKKDKNSMYIEEDEKVEDGKNLDDGVKNVKYIEEDEADKKLVDDNYVEEDEGDKKLVDDKYIEEDEADKKLVDDKYIEEDEADKKPEDDKYVDDKKDDDVKLVDDDDVEIEPHGIRGRLPNLNRNFHPNDVDNLPFIRRAASRGLRAPDIRELLNNAGQKGTPLVPPARNGIDNGLAPSREGDSTVVSWKFTTLRNDMKAQESPDFLSSKDHTTPPKQPNLVRFYCHADSVLVRAQ